MLPAWVDNPLFPEELIDHAPTYVLGTSVGRAVSAMRFVALVLPVPIAVFNEKSLIGLTATATGEQPDAPQKSIARGVPSSWVR